MEGPQEPGASLGARRAGRSCILLERVPEAVAFVGVEIGVEHVSAVEVDLAGHVVRSGEEPFDGPGTPPGRAVRRALDLAFGATPPERLRACEGLGLATPSQVGPGGVVRVAPLLGWTNLDLLALLRETAPPHPSLMVENDADALAIGATCGRGAARAGVTLALNLGTGVGGILIDGRLFRGARGLAGEVGHPRTGVDGPASAVTLEERLGLGGILAELRAGARGVGDDGSRLARFLRDVRDREPGAVEITERWARSLAFGIAQAARHRPGPGDPRRLACRALPARGGAGSRAPPPPPGAELTRALDPR